MNSISIDPYKIGLSATPIGCVLFRDLDNKDQLIDVINKPSTNHIGILESYEMIQYLGTDGFKAMVKGCIENTRRLVSCMVNVLEYQLVTDPLLNISTYYNAKISDNWHTTRTSEGYLKFVTMPHITRNTIESFIYDIIKMNE